MDFQNANVSIILYTEEFKKELASATLTERADLQRKNELKPISQLKFWDIVLLFFYILSKNITVNNENSIIHALVMITNSY